MVRRTLVLALLGSTCLANAWIDSGHEQIADIAWVLMSAEAKKEVAAILAAGDNRFRPTGPSDSEVRASFRRSATWGDWIKVNQNGWYEDSIEKWNAKFHPEWKPDDPDREHWRCRYWHYADYPVRTRGPGDKTENGDLLLAMATARAELGKLAQAKTKDRFNQCWWLYWIEHLVADAHQPLHVATDVRTNPKGDAGGNLFLLGTPRTDGSGLSMNLHYLWDQGIDEAIKREPQFDSDVESVTKRWIKEFPVSKAEVDDHDVAHWARASALLAVESAYKDIAPRAVPSEAYLTRMAGVCRKQAVLAGHRLAAEIERLLDVKP